MPRADYPLILRPHFAERIWGGTRLGAGIGEAWDLSVHPNGPCTVSNGPLQGSKLEEINTSRPDDFGGPIRLLAKRLDCAEDLSVQVHPKRGDPKTETWVVLEAQEGAGVYHGFKRTASMEDVHAAALDGSLPDLMRFVGVRRGQCVFVPSGTLHAIGAGLFLFELQQSADTTYRLFDWGRGRELHLDEGLACTDLDARDAFPTPRTLPDGRLRLVECDYFQVDRAVGPLELEVDPAGSWRAVLLETGGGGLADEQLPPEATALLPAAAGARTLRLSDGASALVYGPPDR